MKNRCRLALCCLFSLSSLSAVASAQAPMTDLVANVFGEEVVGVGVERTYSLGAFNDAGEEGSTATGVTLQGTVAGGEILSIETPAVGACTLDAGVVSCDFGALEPGSFAEVLVLVRAPDQPGSMALSVAVSSSEADPLPENNTVTLEVRVTDQIGDLAVTASAPTHVAARNGEALITYNATLTNQGGIAAPDAHLLLFVPDETIAESYSSECALACDFFSCSLDCAVGTLEPGESATVTLVVRLVDQYATSVFFFAVAPFVPEGGIDLDPENDAAFVATEIAGAANTNNSVTSRQVFDFIEVPCSGDVLFIEGTQHGIVSETTSGQRTRVGYQFQTFGEAEGLVSGSSYRMVEATHEFQTGPRGFAFTASQLLFVSTLHLVGEGDVPDLFIRQLTHVVFNGQGFEVVNIELDSVTCR
jgi:hypothetical protein